MFIFVYGFSWMLMCLYRCSLVFIDSEVFCGEKAGRRLASDGIGWHGSLPPVDFHWFSLIWECFGERGLDIGWRRMAQRMAADYTGIRPPRERIGHGGLQNPKTLSRTIELKGARCISYDHYLFVCVPQELQLLKVLTFW